MAKPAYNPGQPVIIYKYFKYFSGTVLFWVYDPEIGTTYQISTSADPTHNFGHDYTINIYSETEVFGPIGKQIP